MNNKVLSGIVLFASAALVVLASMLTFGDVAAASLDGPVKPFTVTVEPPRPSGTSTVTTDDPDVAQNASGDYALLQAAIAKAVRTHAATLVLSRRTYNIAFPPGTAPNSLLTIANASDLTIDGNGATLILNGFPNRAGLTVSKSNRVVIKNLTMYWADTIAFPGIFRRVGMQKQLRISSDYPIDSKNPPKISTIFQFDIENSVYLRSHSAHFDHVISCPKGSDTCVRYMGGQTFLVDGLNDFSSIPDNSQVLGTVRNNNFAAVLITNGSSNITLDHFILYNSPGAGIQTINAGSGFRLSYCVIGRMPAPKGQPPALISTASDAINFIATGGNIDIEDSDISFEADDGINIRSEVLHMSHWSGSNQPFRVQTSYPDAIKVGDSVDVVDGASFKPIQSGTVTVESFDGSGFSLSISGTASVAPPNPNNLLLVDHRLGSEGFVIKRSAFHDNKNRGIVIRGRNGLIKNNAIYSTSSSGVQLAAEIENATFAEGPPPQNIAVIGNRISNTNRGDYLYNVGQQKFPAAILTYVFADGQFIDLPLINDIIVAGNKISQTPGEAIGLFSSGSITLGNNLVQSTNLYHFNWSPMFNLPLYTGDAIVSAR